MITLLASLALGGVCEEGGLQEGPASVGRYDGQLGTAHRLCPRSEVAVGGGALLLDDTVNNNIYGQILLEGTLRGSLALSEDTELFARVEAFRQHQVITLVTSTYVGPGHTTVGVAHTVSSSDDLRIGGVAQVVLPTAFGLYRNQWPLAVDVGPAFTWGATSAVRVHGQLPVMASIGLGRGPQQLRAGFAPTVGVELRPGKAFAAVIDLNSSVGMRGGFDHLAPKVSLRFAAGDVGVTVDAMVPVLGPTPRPLAVAGLSVSGRFE